MHLQAQYTKNCSHLIVFHYLVKEPLRLCPYHHYTMLSVVSLLHFGCCNRTAPQNQFLSSQISIDTYYFHSFSLLICMELNLGTNFLQYTLCHGRICSISPLLKVPYTKPVRWHYQASLIPYAYHLNL